MSEFDSGFGAGLLFVLFLHVIGECIKQAVEKLIDFLGKDWNRK